MGGSLPIAKGDVKFVIDLDRGPRWHGKPVKLQVLRPGRRVPEVVDVIDTEVGRKTKFTVPLDRADGDWVVVRVSNPAKPNDNPGPRHHPCNDFGIAYTSPWWLTGENTSGPDGSSR